MEKIKNNLYCRTWPGLLLTLLLMVVALPSQAEFYKWTDESGQVHYTQTPPPEQQAEKITVDTGTPTPVATPPAEKEGGVKSCGSITLPGKRLDPVTNIAMYRQAIAVWQKYIDENGKKSDEASQQGVTDRRCAIAYANRELQALSEVEGGINTNYQSARDELDDLEQQVAACDEAEGSVAACKQQHQARMQQLQKMLRTLEQKKKMIELGK